MTIRPLCFASFVFGSYEKYIPFYIYSIAKSYPNAYVKIFTEDTLSKNIQEALNILNEFSFCNFEILKPKLPANYYSEFQIGNGKNQTGKMARWFLEYSHFQDFSYCYIGDVDFLHLPEKIHIVDFHKKNLERFSLPFSNMVRKNEFGKPIRRMAGWHFFNPKEYYEGVEPIIEKLKQDKEYRMSFLDGLERNEHFLYELTKEAFDFNDLQLAEMHRPWHGLHIGISRGNKNIDIQTIENNTSLPIDETKRLLTQFSDDPVFKRLQNIIYILELDVIFQELNINRPVKWRWRRFEYRTQRHLKNVFKHIKRWLKWAIE
tara:strand:+ start:346 stop:1299 length:954 start_codon:yes stop_codon:yes gene_type:complete